MINVVQRGRSTLAPSRGGALVILGLLAFGALILGLLAVTPFAHAPKAPADVPAGAPPRTVRVVCYDLAHQHPRNDPMLDDIRKLNPDYILLQGVDEDDSVAAAELLQMQARFHPQLYQRSEHLAGPKGVWGNLILGRQPLYNGAPLGSVRGGFGASAVSVVDGRKFLIASIHLAGDQALGEAENLTAIWKARGSPPMVAALLKADPTFPPALSWLHAAGVSAGGSGGQWIASTGDFRVIASGFATASGRGSPPFWVDLAGNAK